MKSNEVQYWSDIIASFIGLLTSSFLILTIFRATENKFKSYSHLILISACFDLFLSIVQLCTQHQIVFINGVVYIMPQSFIEKYLFDQVGFIFCTAHVYITYYGVILVAIQFRYRYILIKNGENVSIKVLIKSFVLTTLAVLSMCTLFWVGALKGFQKGREYYINNIGQDADKFLDDESKQRIARDFLYVGDTHDTITALFVVISITVSVSSYGFILFYAFKAWKIVHVLNVSVEKTRHQQRQFLCSLVAQATITTLFAFLPQSLWLLPFMKYVDATLAGTMAMILFSHLSAANSFSTLLIITSYRRYLFSYFFCCTNKDIHSSTNSVGTVRSFERT